jgi:ADP-dependent NAD(P)H-hydrate dehydratase / NAD(P)H-hydrate epimerase
VTDPQYVAGILPRHRTDVHKGDKGRLMIIAGSSGMMGAAVLSANAAMRTGSGVVMLCVEKELRNIINSMSLEVIVDDLSGIEPNMDKCNVIAIGPGLLPNKVTEKLLLTLLSINSKVPLVVDAGAINSLSDAGAIAKSSRDVVLTPHPGEFSKLTGISVEDIQKNRINIASDFAKKNKVTVVLKGAYSVIAGKNGEIFVNPSGNPSMATAGSGDVLCGIISSLIGQGCDTYEAAVAGVFIHSMAAGLGTSIKGEYGLIASDMIDSIPFAMESIV